MKNPSVAFLFCLISSIANAQSFQSSKPVLCAEIKELFKTLSGDFKEIPMWSGKDASNDSRYALFINEKTGTWTILQFSADTACVLGLGEKSSMLPGNGV